MKSTRTSGARTQVGRVAEQDSVERGAEDYEGAFARVRLVRAWIAAAAALVAMLYGYVALLERVVK
ncbi:MAG TPA: hypothetical protein VKA54_15050 [Gemmatimonadaceae bacterium]|nr:hypothetical protein [Gemmatimonadaceae bacterium]